MPLTQRTRRLWLLGAAVWIVLGLMSAALQRVESHGEPRVFPETVRRLLRRHAGLLGLGGRDPRDRVLQRVALAPARGHPARAREPARPAATALLIQHTPVHFHAHLPRPARRRSHAHPAVGLIATLP